MKIDFNDAESIDRAMKEKGEAYVALEHSRDVGRSVTELANATSERLAVQTRAVYVSCGLMLVLSVAVAVLFLTR